jgi:hypothetical protein
MPHPDGNISVTLERKGKEGISAVIDLPQPLTGDFVWKGKTVKLKSGKQVITL